MWGMWRWCVRASVSGLLVLPAWVGCTVDEGAYTFGEDAGASGLSASSGTAGAASGATSTGGRGSGGTDAGVPEGECEAGQTEACGDCGERVCDATTLEWGDCVGDGAQEDCWETAEGEPLPGTVPTELKGNCRIGVQTCQPDGSWSACAGAVAPQPADDCAVAGDDADCNGSTNEGCTCAAGATRDCGTSIGNCEQGVQSCTDNAWSLCEGEIGPQASDSCAAPGDDANCNGMPNEGCLCTADDPSACDDGIECTDDVCNNGVCSHSVSAGFCLIGGECYDHNQEQPGNPCRYCDAAVNKTAWSNSPSTASCDDGLWCNGTDTCNAGTCRHQFTGNRCTATGPCALTACDEARDSCFKPDTEACGTETVTKCQANVCGADVQQQTVTRRCSGASAACDGATQNGNWTTKTNCDNQQRCSGSSPNHSCMTTLGDCGTWCDDELGLCWTTGDQGSMTQEEAIEHCDQLTFAGRSNWRLPSIDEYLASVNRGCNGRDNGSGEGTPRAGRSTCQLVEGVGAVDCSPCPDGGGTGAGGCYWPTEFGSCAHGISDVYWSSTPGGGIHPAPVGFHAGRGMHGWYPTSLAEHRFRCVTTR